MAEFMKHYEVLLKKAKVDLRAAKNLYDYAVEGRYAFIHEDIKEVDNYIKMLDKVLSDFENDS